MSKVRTHAEIYPKEFSELVKDELDSRYSREVVSLAATDADLPIGAVLARTGSTYAPAKSGETAVAILIKAAPKSESVQPGLVLRGYCIVNQEELKIDESLDKSTALAALRDAGIICMEVQHAAE